MFVEKLRKHKFFGLAIFDLVTSFIGYYSFFNSVENILSIFKYMEIYYDRDNSYYTNLYNFSHFIWFKYPIKLYFRFI